MYKTTTPNDLKKCADEIVEQMSEDDKLDFVLEPEGWREGLGMSWCDDGTDIDDLLAVVGATIKIENPVITPEVAREQCLVSIVCAKNSAALCKALGQAEWLLMSCDGADKENFAKALASITTGRV